MVAEAAARPVSLAPDGRSPDDYADRWAETLERPIREIRQALVDTSPEADDLRQTSPFAGLLSQPERRPILEEVR